MDDGKYQALRELENEYFNNTPIYSSTPSKYQIHTSMHKKQLVFNVLEYVLVNPGMDFIYICFCVLLLFPLAFIQEFL